MLTTCLAMHPQKLRLCCLPVSHGHSPPATHIPTTPTRSPQPLYSCPPGHTCRASSRPSVLPILHPSSFPPTLCACARALLLCTPTHRRRQEHVVSIIAALLLRLSGDAHTRTVHKFVENDFEKLDKLMELHGVSWLYYVGIREVRRGYEVDVRHRPSGIKGDEML